MRQGGAGEWSVAGGGGPGRVAGGGVAVVGRGRLAAVGWAGSWSGVCGCAGGGGAVDGGGFRGAAVAGGSGGGDFEFISMEADEPGLLWFRRQPSGRWRAGSIHQDDIAVSELDWRDVVAGCERFVEAVDRWVRYNLGIDVDDVLAADDA